MAFADILPSNIGSKFSQLPLTAFQSGVISPSSPISLLCSALSPFLFHISLLVSFKQPSLPWFDFYSSFVSWPANPCSVNLYLCRSASHTVCDSLFSHTPVVFTQGAKEPHDLSVCTCVSQQGYFCIHTYSWILCKASLEQACFLWTYCTYVFMFKINFYAFRILLPWPQGERRKKWLT